MCPNNSRNECNWIVWKAFSGIHVLYVFEFLCLCVHSKCQLVSGATAMNEMRYKWVKKLLTKHSHITRATSTWFVRCAQDARCLICFLLASCSAYRCQVVAHVFIFRVRFVSSFSAAIVYASWDNTHNNIVYIQASLSRVTFFSLTKAAG